LLAEIAVLFVLAFTTTRCRSILECVKEIPLLSAHCSIHQSQSFTVLQLAAALPEPLEESFPFLMVFPTHYLPIEDLVRSMCPQTECHQHDHLPARALLARALAPVKRDRFVSTVDRDPHAVHLEHWGKSVKPLPMRTVGQGFDLVDPFIERSQAHTSLNRCAPARCHLLHTLTEATANEHILIQIHPTPLLLLPNGKRSDHIALTLLTFHHRHPQIAEMPPTRVQTATVMTVTDDMVRILASTEATSPARCPWLSTHLTRFAFLPSSCDADIGFQNRFEDGCDRRTGGSLCLLLHGLLHVLAPLTLERSSL
jgi:hypothetical protein